MPELPEVEITARRLSEALAGEEVRSALAPGINALKTFDPPLHALEGRTVEAIRRIGKHLVIDLDGDLHVLLHLMSAGRLQLYPKKASLRDKTSRLLLRFDGDPYMVIDGRGELHEPASCRPPITIRAWPAASPSSSWTAVTPRR